MDVIIHVFKHVMWVFYINGLKFLKRLDCQPSILNFYRLKDYNVLLFSTLGFVPRLQGNYENLLWWGGVRNVPKTASSIFRLRCN